MQRYSIKLTEDQFIVLQSLLPKTYLLKKDRKNMLELEKPEKSIQEDQSVKNDTFGT